MPLLGRSPISGYHSKTPSSIFEDPKFWKALFWEMPANSGGFRGFYSRGMPIQGIPRKIILGISDGQFGVTVRGERVFGRFQSWSFEHWGSMCLLLSPLFSFPLFQACLVLFQSSLRWTCPPALVFQSPGPPTEPRNPETPKVHLNNDFEVREMPFWTPSRMAPKAN